MEAILNSLGGLLLKALPTLALLLLVHFYLKRTFFRPLEHVLRARRDATEGVRKLAEDTLAKAAEKTSEYEAAIRAARTDLYLEQEQLRRQFEVDGAASIRAARQSAEEMVKQARAQFVQEAEQAKLSLAYQSEELAGKIAAAILERRPA